MREYFKKQGISQSFLKAVIEGPAAIAKYMEQGERDYNLSTGDSLVIGSAVDCKLTTPGEFDKEYFLQKEEIDASDVVKQVAAKLISDKDFRIEAVNENAIVKYANELNYGKGKYEASRILSDMNKKNLPQYLRFLVESDGKIILNPKRQKELEKTYNVFKTCKFISPFITEHHGSVDRYYQVERYWKYQGHQCKGLLDMVMENTSDKNITFSNGFILPAGKKCIVDFKTGWMRPEFLPYYSFDRRIDFQLSWYQSSFEDLDNFINPVIVYATPNTDHGSWMHLLDADMHVGLFGYEYDDQFKKSLLGWKNALELYERYLKSEQWNVEIDLLNDNGQTFTKY